MDIAMVGAWVAIVSVVLIIGVYIGFPKVGKKNMKKAYTVLIILALVGAVAWWGVFDNVSTEGFSFSGDSATTSGPALAIQTATFQTEDALSGSRTGVAEVLQVYKEDVDPKDPLANPLATGTFVSGVVSINNTLKTGTPYRIIVDGSVGTYYSEDFGIVSLSADDLEVQSGLLITDLSEVPTVSGAEPFVSIATMTDMIDEVTNSTDLNGGNYNVNCTQGTAEICSAADAGTADNLAYDESVGDGQFYVDLTFEATGSNQGLREDVICFEFSTSNGAEGNEISALTMQLQTGADRGVPSNILNFWTNEECLQLDDLTLAGTTSEYRMTVSVTEANLDTNDGWVLYHDDLGERGGKDIGLNTGVATDSITFDAQA